MATACGEARDPHGRAGLQGRPRTASPTQLRSCYEESLRLALGKEAETIAFPCISTGVYGYPKAEACKIAVDTVIAWLKQNEVAAGEVVFCCFGSEDGDLYRQHLVESRRRAGLIAARALTGSWEMRYDGGHRRNRRDVRGTPCQRSRDRTRIPGSSLRSRDPTAGARPPRPRGWRHGCARPGSTWSRAATRAAPTWATGSARSCSTASSTHLSLRTEMLIYMASRAQLVDEVIAPSLAAGRVVVSDRFLLSTLVYQGIAGGLAVEEIWRDRPGGHGRAAPRPDAGARRPARVGAGPGGAGPRPDRGPAAGLSADESATASATRPRRRPARTRAVPIIRPRWC